MLSNSVVIMGGSGIESTTSIFSKVYIHIWSQGKKGQMLCM